jgi:hypothetical protein
MDVNNGIYHGPPIVPKVYDFLSFELVFLDSLGLPSPDHLRKK